VPSQISPESAADKRAGLLPSALPRVAICAAWTPLLVLIAVYVPRFEDLFASLHERGELPAVTAWLLSLSRLNDALFFLLAFGLLTAVDIALTRWLRRSRRGESLYWVWFAGVVVVGVLASALVVVALLLPVMKMSTTI